MRTAVLLLTIGLTTVVLLQEKIPQQRLTDSITFHLNENVTSYSADTLRFMSFGYSHAAASLLWIHFLEQTPPRKIERDQLSWLYYDLDAITEIDPFFYPAYEQGGVFISVITDDKIGAERILLKGTRYFPERWRIRAYLGYHYEFELGQPDKALEHYKAGAVIPGASPLLGMMASSLMSSREGVSHSIAFLEGLLKDAKDPAIRKRLEEKLERFKKGMKDGKPIRRHSVS